MEIRDQAVGRLEAVARSDEDGSVALERMDRAVLIRRGFEQAQARRSDRDQPAAGFSHSVKPLGCRGIDPPPFGMHLMARSIVGLYGQERARTNVKRQRLTSDSPSM